MEHLGPIAGLGAAACWAFASVLYMRVPIGAGAMTTFKNCLAAACLGLILWTTAMVYRLPMFQASAVSWCYLGLSGVIGLSLADIAYFRSIQILGPRQGLALTLLGPPATAILGQWALGESLSLQIWTWIIVTIVGIGVVLRERTQKTADQEVRPGPRWWGLMCAVLGIAAMASGSVIMKRGTVGVGSVEGTFIRLFVAAVFGVLLSLVLGQLREIQMILRNRRATIELCTATFLGTALGVWLILVAYKHCATGIAATLTSTSPLFVIPIVYFVYKQKMTPLSIIGAGVAFGGVCGLLLGR